MTGIYINGVSGKMGANLLKRSTKDSNVEIYNDLNDKFIDVIIDFSYPDSTIELLKFVSNKNISVIIGTTGLNIENIQFIKEISKDKRILLAPNLSRGISVLKNNIVDFLRGK